MDRRFAVVLAPEGVEIREDHLGLHADFGIAWAEAKKMAGWPAASPSIWPGTRAPLWFTSGAYGL